MLSAFLESGNSLSSLSRSQLSVLQKAFMLYLLQAIKFNDAMRICNKVLDEDQEHMKVVIKTKLAEMIENPDCNLIYKPAILRLANGDYTGFRRLGVSISPTLKIIRTNFHLVEPQLKKIKYPISVLGPSHIGKLEKEQLPLVEKHAFFYVKRFARFLTQGDSGISVEEMVKDLIIIALRTMRWYYPYISELHLTNTMRRSITNRGRGMISYNVVESRRRIINDENGNTVNRESTTLYARYGSLVDNWLGFSNNPINAVDARMSLNSLQCQNNNIGKVASFILSEDSQAKFVKWVNARFKTEETDIMSAIRHSGKTGVYLICKYLNIDRIEFKGIIQFLDKAEFREALKDTLQAA
jgi:hypothetical protein